MSNLLPQRARKKVWADYRARFVFAGSCVAFVSALLAGTALLPSYLVLRVSGEAPPAPSATAASTTQEDRAAIQGAQALLTALSPLLKATTTPAQMISAALSERPPGVTVGHITLTSGKPGTMILAGSATDIGAINSYRKTLSADARFSSVSVPVGDLAGTQNGQFSITLTGEF
jgi:hypothetical protein